MLYPPRVVAVPGEKSTGRTATRHLWKSTQWMAYRELNLVACPFGATGGNDRLLDPYPPINRFRQTDAPGPLGSTASFFCRS